MSPEAVAWMNNVALRFLTPVPFATFLTLSHCSKIFGLRCAPRDPLLDNIASVLATYYMLSALGVIERSHMQQIHDYVDESCSHDFVQPGDLVAAPKPLLHFVVESSLRCSYPMRILHHRVCVLVTYTSLCV